MGSIRSSSNPYSQHPPPNRARYPLDCPRIAHTASGAFLWVLTPYDGAKSVQGILVRSRDWMGNKDVESFALSAKESATRTRGRVTTTTSSAATTHSRVDYRLATTKSRGTPIDADDSRGTGLRIIHIITSTGGRGSKFPTTKKGGSDHPPLQKLSKAPIPARAHFPSNSPQSPPMFPTGNLPSW
jgi:hypothetical protein